MPAVRRLEAGGEGERCGGVALSAPPRAEHSNACFEETQKRAAKGSDVAGWLFQARHERSEVMPAASRREAGGEVGAMRGGGFRAAPRAERSNARSATTEGGRRSRSDGAGWLFQARHERSEVMPAASRREAGGEVGAMGRGSFYGPATSGAK